MSETDADRDGGAEKVRMQDPSVIKEVHEKLRAEPLLIKSDLPDLEARVYAIVEALADLICEIILFGEPSVADELRKLKFKRYNADFFEKFLK